MSQDTSWATKPIPLPKEDDFPVNIEKTKRVVHHLESNVSQTPSISSSTGSSLPPTIAEPLSWREAHLRMRDVLKMYMESSRTDNTVNSSTRNLAASEPVHIKIVNFWFTRNFDSYFGSILISLILMVLSAILYVKELQESDTDDIIKDAQLMSKKRLYLSHIVASVLLLFGSLMSVLAMHRRRQTSMRGIETKKRNIIASFLPVLDEMLEGNYEPLNAIEDVKGTSLTDIYPVYRLSSDGKGGHWHKVPSLLLVKGDFIALQIGDIAPADCEIVTGSKIGHSVAGVNKMKSAPNLKALANLSPSSTEHHIRREPIIVTEGERIAPPEKAKNDARTNIQTCDPLFIAGKSKLQSNSRKLLHLTNNSKVYQLLETPISQYLRKSPGKREKPQIHRKVDECRHALYLFSICILVLSFIVLFIRHAIQPINFSITLNLPLFAAIGCLPVSTPLIAIVLEIVGTSRILVTVHPYVSNVKEKTNKNKLFIQYFLRGLESRMEIAKQCTKRVLEQSLMDFPISSYYLYEKLGVVTALSLIDDELACDPISTPQQLLIPTSKGLKLLDLFPKCDEDFDEDDSVDNNSDASSNDTDSDWGHESQEVGNNNESDNADGKRRMKVLRYFKRRYKKNKLNVDKNEEMNKEVEFEDPTWWKLLPSLKCIGLAGLLVDKSEEELSNSLKILSSTFVDTKRYIPGTSEVALVNHVSRPYDRSHLRILSSAIGFSTEPNSFGAKGDISSFTEIQRLRIIATRLVNRRRMLDRHQISLEESRSWGSLRADATSVLIKDDRSQGYQLMTVGDARIVTDVCSESWSGDTITPFNTMDRSTILENSKNWSLADLDVTAFALVPIPYSIGKRIESQHKRDPISYLIDNRMNGEVPATLHKESASEDWSLVKNQIFLGLLGSSVSPRRDVVPLIEDCDNAGVRFVYFSPRNMRRTKELASQMGIDISWNCAISLRPLDEGEEADEHRMTSNYADWDINAKLPHGVEAVKRHLVDVDNVPLLVRLFTDVTRSSTCEMTNVFKLYHDTVLSLGLSHISQNDDTFASSDLAFGIDILSSGTSMEGEDDGSSQFRKELLFVSKIASYSCVFNLSSSNSCLLNMAEIIERGRCVLASGMSASLFVIFSSIVFTASLFTFTLSSSTPVPIISASTVILHTLVIVPMIAIAMAFSQGKDDIMNIVPPKNDQKETWERDEKWRLFFHMLLRSILPIIGCHLVFLISYASMVIEFDIDAVEFLCGEDAGLKWTSIFRCSELSKYIGVSSLAASTLMLTELSFCIIIQSASFLFGTQKLGNPWKKNRAWVCIILSCIVINILYLHGTLPHGSVNSLPWYFFIIFILFPFMSLFICEVIKASDRKFEQRNEQFRRLKFDTRLGMWSPRCNAFSPHQRYTINQPLKSKCVDYHNPNSVIEVKNVPESSARRSLMQSLLLGLFCAPTSTLAKDILKKGTIIEVKDPETYSGLVYQPLGALDPDKKSKYPILFVFHGAGKNTEDIWNLANIKGEHSGLIPSLIADGIAPKELYDNFIVVAPYSKDKASFYDEPRSKLLQYMRFVINEDGGGKQGVVTDSLDLDRKFLFGFSDGATLGVELMTTRKFQGGIFCAYGFTGTLPSLALERLKGLPMWIFHSADDVIFPVKCSDNLVRSLNQVNNGGDIIRYSRFDTDQEGFVGSVRGHSTGITASKNPEIYNWMLSQKNL